MNFVKEEYESTFEEKKSKFIAYLFPYNKFDEIMKRLKEKHPKARHHVYAYRYLNEYEQIVENSSDDGEPKGTSGKPSLHVLAGHELINTAVIIVRYFGGIKLGTGGLVRAYSDAVNSVINESEIFEYKKLITLCILCDYSLLSKVEYIISQYSDIFICNKEFTSEVKLFLSGTKEAFESFKNDLPREVSIS